MMSWLESPADREHGGGAPGVLRLASGGERAAAADRIAVGEAVQFALAAVALRVGVDVRQADQPAAHVLGDAELPVGVAAVGDVAVIEVTDVTVDAPALAQIVVRRQVEVGGAARALIDAVAAAGAEIVADGVVVFQGEELPAAGNVEFLVIDGAGVLVAADHLGFRTRVVVVQRADVDAEITERGLVAAVEIHFQIAFRITRTGTHVGVPVPGVEAARMRVVDAALQRGLAERLVDAAEPVAGEQTEVSRDGVRAGGFRRRCCGLGHGRRAEGGRQKCGKDEFLHKGLLCCR